MELTFKAPNNPLSINEANRMHWAAKKRRLDPWAQCVEDAWSEQGDSSVIGVPCTVTIHLPFRTRQRKDPHNYTGTMVKRIIDTLVRCGVWPDDTPEWVAVVDPVISVGSEDCRIVLEPR